MIQINPDEQLPIIRQLADPTDSNTYYVRAFIYKHKGTGEELVATVDLADKTGQRFTYYYQAPGDSDPYHLVVITKVYTDSGYTTLSARYTIETIDYLVSERWGLMYGGGGGEVGVDYNKIQKMIRKELKEMPQPEKPQRISFNEVLSAIKKTDNRVKGIDIPKPKEADLSSIVRVIEKVGMDVKNIPELPEIPEPEKVDLDPVIGGLGQVQEKIDKIEKINEETIRTLLSIDGLAEELKGLRKDFNAVLFIKTNEEREEENNNNKRKFV